MNVLVFGDSIVWGAADLEGGWVQRLRHALEVKFTYNNSGPDEYFIYNLGIGNETSDKLLKRFRQEAFRRIDEDGAAIIIQIGENDSRFVKSKGGFEVSIEKFESNIKDLIFEARKLTSRLMFVGLCPVNEEKTSPLLAATIEDIIYYKNENIETFNNTIARVCKSEGIPFADIYSRLSKVDYKRLLYSDGVHPNGKGHEKIFEIVKKELLRNKMID